MPTLVGLPVGCAFAALAVGSNTEESEVATGEFEAPLSALELLVYVPACGCAVKTIKESRADESKQAKTY